jgi:hypothetical protein
LLRRKAEQTLRQRNGEGLPINQGYDRFVAYDFARAAVGAGKTSKIEMEFGIWSLVFRMFTFAHA